MIMRGGREEDKTVMKGREDREKEKEEEEEEHW